MSAHLELLLSREQRAEADSADKSARTTYTVHANVHADGGVYGIRATAAEKALNRLGQDMALIGDVRSLFDALLTLRSAAFSHLEGTAELAMADLAIAKARLHLISGRSGVPS